jgi:uncharacterized protein
MVDARDQSIRMKSTRLLLIFYRNPELGKVKTRLAKTVGDVHALNYYRRLARHTREVTRHLKADRAVWYSHEIEASDEWPAEQYTKQLQQGDELGEKMAHAFTWGFACGYQSICIIGTDCHELTTDLLEQAFQHLETGEAVIGPARDGGYYLLGMNTFRPEYFQKKAWSTDTVAKDTMADFQRMSVSYSTLTTLTDVDEEKDLPKDWLEHLIS